MPYESVNIFNGQWCKPGTEAFDRLRRHRIVRFKCSEVGPLVVAANKVKGQWIQGYFVVTLTPGVEGPLLDAVLRPFIKHIRHG